MSAQAPFAPALIVVDFQEDFCPPHGSLAVPHGRSIAPPINALLALPFALKIATRDWHPPDHVSFAANHPAASPFASSAIIRHPADPSRRYATTLWPVHCLQHSPGAQLVPELHAPRLHAVLDKGQDPRLEMYSAFHDPFRLAVTPLRDALVRDAVTDVFVVGLAADYCVKATAEHALEEGFRAFIVEEGTRPVLPDQWEECRRRLMDKGVKMVSMDGEEIARVRALS